jgi:hypothetical protein
MPIMVLVMFRTLLTFVILRRLRIRSPQLFDGARALAAINACIEQDLAESANWPVRRDEIGAPPPGRCGASVRRLRSGGSARR